MIIDPKIQYWQHIVNVNSMYIKTLVFLTTFMFALRHLLITVHQYHDVFLTFILSMGSIICMIWRSDIQFIINRKIAHQKKYTKKDKFFKSVDTASSKLDNKTAYSMNWNGNVSSMLPMIMMYLFFAMTFLSIIYPIIKDVKTILGIS